jgi:hypothetical protein
MFKLAERKKFKTALEAIIVLVEATANEVAPTKNFVAGV